MLDLLKKTYLLGLGLASLTREKVEEIVDDLIKRGEVAEKDRGKVVEDFVHRIQEEREKLRHTVRDFVKKTVHDMGLPTRDDYEDLEKRIVKLERKQKAKKGDGPAS